MESYDTFNIVYHNSACCNLQRSLDCICLVIEHDKHATQYIKWKQNIHASRITCSFSVFYIKSIFLFLFSKNIYAYHRIPLVCLLNALNLFSSSFDSKQNNNYIYLLSIISIMFTFIKSGHFLVATQLLSSFLVFAISFLFGGSFFLIFICKICYFPYILLQNKGMEKIQLICVHRMT